MSAPSPKQIAARKRNWRIRNLRSLWALAGQLSPNHADHARSIIDAELRLMGAEGERERRERQWAEIEAEIEGGAA